MAEEEYQCRECGARFTVDEGEEDLNCSECGSGEIERFVDILYARDRDYVRELAEAVGAAKKSPDRRQNREKKRGAA